MNKTQRMNTPQQEKIACVKRSYIYFLETQPSSASEELDEDIDSSTTGDSDTKDSE